MKQTYVVTEIDELVRLDRFLRKKLSVPQSSIEKMIRKNKILLNGKKTSSSEIILKGQEITLYQTIESKQKYKNKNKNTLHSKKAVRSLLKTIEYEDEEIIIINKPANLSSQCGTKSSISVDSIIREYNEDYKITHRLDKETSGLMILAKNRKVAKKISELFRDRKIKKKYIAIVCGSIKKKSGIIKDPILQDGLEKSSETRFKVIKRIYKHTLIEAELITGRKHQIRIHMSNASHPILGDNKHGHHTSKDSNLYLHAYSINIDGKIEKKTPIPKHFLNKMKLLETKKN